ncbi:amidohydrolase [Citricoccus sp. SGAir0253]|uniref:amidohydrolase family protein n=1 Tax=Citricoccus sp. SGAir0253 TaxID=2567881 RepID=UPI0010CD0891|nr:amidohydrolase family protein [Citricoccus sp. SGAir0253]QCU77078.1 amidohydrolase [Citricoccus sp. SGAir0253]
MGQTPVRYECAVDVDAITAVDMHVHLEVDDCGHVAMPDDIMEASAKYFKAAERTPSIDSIAETYRAHRMAAVVFTVDARTQMGHLPNSIDDLVAGCARHHDVLIPFGSVDPRTGPAAIAEARRQAEELGVRGFKFHPSVQGFNPSDEQYFPLWAELERFGLPCIFHTGQNGMGAGLPGGRGIKLKYSNPLLLDDVAAEHPGLPIIMAHPSVPWQDEANSIATHKANVYIDLSGWSPKYFPESLVRQSNNVLSRKVLFGTDFPLITPDQWLKAFAELPLKDEVRPRILKDNAVGLLGLGSRPAAGTPDAGRGASAGERTAAGGAA